MFTLSPEQSVKSLAWFSEALRSALETPGDLVGEVRMVAEMILAEAKWQFAATVLSDEQFARLDYDDFADPDDPDDRDDFGHLLSDFG